MKSRDQVINRNQRGGGQRLEWRGPTCPGLLGAAEVDSQFPVCVAGQAACQWISLFPRDVRERRRQHKQQLLFGTSWWHKYQLLLTVAPTQHGPSFSRHQHLWQLNAFLQANGEPGIQKTSGFPHMCEVTQISKERASCWDNLGSIWVMLKLQNSQQYFPRDEMKK